MEPSPQGPTRPMRALTFVTGLMFVAAACTGSGGGDVGGSYSVTIAFHTTPISLDPHKENEVPGRIVYGNIYESLLRRSPDGETITPLLAAELPRSIDDLTWEVALRDDVTFADGKRLVAADVVYTIERVTDPALESDQTPLFATMQSVEAVDESTVRIRTENPDPILPSRLSLLLIMPEGGADVEGFPSEGLNGTGAYELVRHRPEVETVIAKRSDYWGDAAGAPDEMTLDIIPEEATRVASLEAGEIDVVIQLSPDQIQNVPRAESVTGTETALLRLNTLRAPLSDLRLRQAINMAIDRETIVNTLFEGRAEPAKCQIAGPTVFGHDPSLSVPRFDPDGARQLLEDADAVGTTLSFTATDRFAKTREVAQAVAQYLEDVGFEVDLQFPTDVDTLRAQFLERDSFPDIFYFQSNTEFFDVSQQTEWITTTGTFSAASNPDIDELAQQATSTVDPDARRDLYFQLAELMCQDVANTYLYNPQDNYGLSERIDWSPRADGLIVLTEFRQA